MARVISFHYTLTDKAGKVIDSSRGGEAFSFIEGAHQIIPGLEKRIAGLNKGDKKKIEVSAAEAYGLRDEKKIMKVSRARLPKADLKVGDRFNGGRETGAPVFVVTEISEDQATLDGNHPLAGVDLTFDVEMVGFREATDQEIAHGHAHGEHGRSH